MSYSLNGFEFKLNDLYKQYDKAVKCNAIENQRDILLQIAKTYTEMAKLGNSVKQVNIYRDKASKIRNKFLNLLNIEDETTREVKGDRTQEKQITFSDVIGLENVKNEIQKLVIDPFKYPEYAEIFSNVIKPGGGIILYGKPGNGKTMLANAIANECKADFYKSVNLNEILSKYHGESEKYIASLFHEARKHKISVLFFDEFDSIAQERSDGDSARVDNKLVNQLLQELDNNKQVKGKALLIIAATNRLESIDSSIKRSGRFDRKFLVPTPDLLSRRTLLKKTVEKVPHEHIDFDFYSKQTENFSFADIDALIQEACKLSRQRAINTSTPIEKVLLLQVDMGHALKNIKESKNNYENN